MRTHFKLHSASLLHLIFTHSNSPMEANTTDRHAHLTPPNNCPVTRLPLFPREPMYIHLSQLRIEYMRKKQAQLRIKIYRGIGQNRTCNVSKSVGLCMKIMKTHICLLNYFLLLCTFSTFLFLTVFVRSTTFCFIK